MSLFRPLLFRLLTGIGHIVGGYPFMIPRFFKIQKECLVGACCGGPQIVLEKAGAVNVFEKQGLDDRRIWDRIEWEDIVPTDPDLIVLIELSTESAGKRLE